MVICIFLGCGNVVLAEEQTTQEIETNKSISGASDDYTQEEYDEFNKEQETSYYEIPKTYYYVTFIDKVNKTKKIIKVEKNETVKPIKVKKEKIKIKRDTYKSFHCWVDSKGNYYDFRKKVSGNITLYAHFIKYTVEERNVALHTVRFDSQGGSWIQTKDNISGIIKEPNSPYKDGYVFKGWYTKAVGGKRWNFKKNTVSSDVILYAHWKKKDNANKLTSPKTGYNYELIYEIFIISFCLILLSMYKLYRFKREME